MTNRKGKNLVKRSYWVSVEQAAKVTRESKRVSKLGKKTSESEIMRILIDASPLK